MDYTRHVNDRLTSQRERARPDQVKNSAGGYVFEVTDWVKLDRFLVLGTEGGSYYATEKALTLTMTEAVRRCIAEDGECVVRRVVEISDGGRAPKNDAALFVLAACAKTGNRATRAAAWAALPKVARTGTHLFQMATNIEAFGGWGRATKRAIGDWYQNMDPGRLAYQVAKYRNRHSWTHRDLLRLSKPKPRSEEHERIYRWVVGKGGTGTPWLEAVDELGRTTDAKTAVRLIREHKIPRECVPTPLLNSAEVWDALLDDMPLTAMIRNLGVMTTRGLVAPMSDGARRVCAALADGERLRKSRVHPLSVLVALTAYAHGRGFKGDNTWAPERSVVDALDGAFYAAFGNVEATGKRTMLALDVSGSMAGNTIAGTVITPRVASAAMALVTAATESTYCICGFSDTFRNLPISPRQRLNDAVRAVSDLPFARTDCAIPMLAALQCKLEVDTFVIYTDSETWCGQAHPYQALRTYRERTGIAAKLAVVGMVSNGFSIADPNDAGMLDVVGFDTATPQLLAEFSLTQTQRSA